MANSPVSVGPSLTGAVVCWAVIERQLNTVSNKEAGLRHNETRHWPVFADTVYNEIRAKQIMPLGNKDNYNPKTVLDVSQHICFPQYLEG